MREFKIILPSFGHDHNAKLLEFEEKLVSIYGGFTRTHADGSWAASSGRVIREPVLVYHVAASVDDKHRVTRLARQVARDFDETRIYVRYHDGEVEFVSP